MERLQAAIDKARAQRDGELGIETQSQRSRPKPASSAEQEAAWLAVPEIKLRSSLLSSKRVFTVQSGPIAAPFDILRTRVIQQAQSNGWRRIAVVSPRSGSGKTTTVANLAFGLARQQGIRTIAMDADLRRNGLGRVLGQKGDVPMSDVLNGLIPFSHAARRYGSNLIFGLGFGAAGNPAAILQSAISDDVLRGIEAKFGPDIFLFDMPPLSASDDNLGFLTRVDAALIVVEAEKTRSKEFDVAERQVSELTNVMGVVLNKCVYTSGAYGYEEGYY
ncbi:Chromosome partitioning ATPase, Mrp family, contains Fe-S cluster [Roseivivax lentus]|uniref:Chromosome partitioning ATPase, Mrp family, contains Fe-S cluster n=1 Tax=Roseivivax lentus TaxID=633194 RepID=A0A1N7Q237_9RHOB|nr:CpsD/CapB family tyrosine-protein kinase [Roseivivax lentus]SIT16954.1 Chromosome partitioning ATPase, Mrp family, contains Fe-S cluster [Roseivivax lentus]